MTFSSFSKRCDAPNGSASNPSICPDANAECMPCNQLQPDELLHNDVTQFQPQTFGQAESSQAILQERLAANSFDTNELTKADESSATAETLLHGEDEESSDTLGLTMQQQKAVRLILAGNSSSQIAEEVGVHRSTVWRWKNYDETFRKYLEVARELHCQEAAESFRDLVPQALEILRKQIQQGSFPAAVRVFRLAGIGANNQSRVQSTLPVTLR